MATKAKKSLKKSKPVAAKVLLAQKRSKAALKGAATKRKNAKAAAAAGNGLLPLPKEVQQIQFTMRGNSVHFQILEKGSYGRIRKNIDPVPVPQQFTQPINLVKQFMKPENAVSSLAGTGRTYYKVTGLTKELAQALQDAKSY